MKTNEFPKLLLTMLIISFSISMNSCKKGENDPFLSLKSRTARITGEWKMTKLSITGSSKDDASSPTEVFSSNYNGTIWTTLYGGTTTSYTYSEELTIDKDGSYKQIIIDDADTYTTEGAWYWAGKSKELELKNKEAIVLTGLKYIDDGYTETYEGSDVDPETIYVIDKLKNKEMVIIFNYKSSDSDGYLFTYKGEITYEK